MGMKIVFLAIVVNLLSFPAHADDTALETAYGAFITAGDFAMDDGDDD